MIDETAQTLALDELAARKWLEVVPLIDKLVERANTRGEWQVLPGTALAGDDSATDPYHLSHAVRLLLNAGIDNLNGVRHLVFGRPDAEPPSIVLHQATHFVLARGAIENFATAIWLIGPRQRPERVERVLRWHAQNIKDQHSAVDRFGPEVAGPRTKEDKLRRLEDLMRALDSDRGIRRGYLITETVKFADEFTGDEAERLSTHFIWQLCSGFAHARPWAALSVLEKEVHDTDRADVVHLRMTSDLPRALMAPHRAVELCEVLLKRWEKLNATR